MAASEGLCSGKQTVFYSNFCHSAELPTQISVILHGSHVRLVADA